MERASSWIRVVLSGDPVSGRCCFGSTCARLNCATSCIGASWICNGNIQNPAGCQTEAAGPGPQRSALYHPEGALSRSGRPTTRVRRNGLGQRHLRRPLGVRRGSRLGVLWVFLRTSRSDPRMPSTIPHHEGPYTRPSTSDTGMPSTSPHREDPYTRANTSTVANRSRRSNSPTSAYPGDRAPPPHSSDRL